MEENRKIKKVGVVGCGTMGSGIVQVCAQSGYQTVVAETNEGILKKGLAKIDAFMTKGIERGKGTQQEKESTLARIKAASSLNDLSDCDLVIESVNENIDLKKKIFSDLDKICSDHTILGTNTSNLCIMEITQGLKKQDQSLGIHFFNPVPIMKLVELAPSIVTSGGTLKAVMGFVKSIGKEYVMVKDTPGFIVNRLNSPYMLNAIRMFESGIASIEDIDKAVKLGLNYPMGPFELMDFGGLDMMYASVKGRYEELLEAQYSAPVLLKRMVLAGRLGRKVGKGWYEYNEKGEKTGVLKLDKLVEIG
ncbi:MAG TPA: 3-hydroxyacyl-CoA dehydrogenase family protein [Syntrophorhabdaceae bacterium]|nr:3-hydroxyacyl-CoA dehydrogenase family protein [Syntrophorhabdaceae bacterium]